MAVDRRALWVPTERARIVEAAYPTAAIDPSIPAVDQPRADSEEQAAATVLRGWLECSGPVTATELVDRLALPLGVVESALARLEGEGQVLRGQFSAAGRVVGAETEWCNRRVLARIHRLTLGRLRREIEPVSAADFVRFLARWQHVAPGTQLHGATGLLHVLAQLQGYEISAAAWERDVLPRRVANYDRDMLDRLCLSGEVMWGRLSPHPAFDLAAVTLPRTRRVRPTRVAPVGIWLRESDWLLHGMSEEGFVDVLSHPAREVLVQLRARGASFLRDLVRATRRLPSEVEDGLWELVAGGLVTADGFDNLRALVDPKRRRGEGRHRAARPRHAAGRWALLGERPIASSSADLPEWPSPETVERVARQLLARWGVVFRDLLARESVVPPWREVLSVLRRLEATGEIRGGRFVDGFLGEQFALPDALDALRVLRRAAADETQSREPLRVSAADPLNLVGIVTPGERVSALSAGPVDVLSPLATRAVIQKYLGIRPPMHPD